MTHQYFTIIKKTPIWLALGLVIMIAAWWMFFTNMRYSIQFTGGMEIVVDQTITPAALTQLGQALEDKGYTDINLWKWSKDGFDSVRLQVDVEDDAQVQDITDLVEQTLLATNTITNRQQIVESTITWPSIGDYITKTAKNALIRGIILMAVYILFAFAGMRGLISPALLGVITIIAMIFDVSAAAGGYGLLMYFNETVQIDVIFIIALLTVLGYSVNDTIIIFDRIRENFLDKKKALDEGRITHMEIFETSLRQTMRRSLATSFSTFFVVVCMYIFGTGILKMFAFTMGVWVIAGTFSSIFIAAPLAYLFVNKKHS